MTNKEKIIDYISNSNKILCDDCLSEELQIYPRQSVNQIANKLKKEERFIREKRNCDKCLKNKLSINIKNNF